MLPRKITFLLYPVISILVIVIVTTTGALFASRFSHPSDLYLNKQLVDSRRDIVIEPVSIIDVATGSIANQKQITIQQGQIYAIHEAGSPPPKGFRIINGNNHYVIPGLIDMHTHIYDRKDLVNSLARGITSVRNMRGFPIHLQMKAEINAHEWLGASIYSASPVLDNANSDVFQHSLTTADEAENAVQIYHDAGYDLLKVYNFLPKDVLLAIIRKAKELNIPIAKHGPFAWVSENSFSTSALNEFQSIEHVEEIYQTMMNFTFDEEVLNNHLSKIKASDTFLTPTLATYDHLTQLSLHKERVVAEIELKRINPFFRFLLGQLSVQRWLEASKEQAEWNVSTLKILMDITRQAHDKDIPLLVGSDQGTMFMVAGRSTHKEMQLLQAAGLPPLSVLQAATINSAKALNLQHKMGAISVGKDADLILLNDNPLEDVSYLSEPRAVIKHGYYFDQNDISALKQSGLKPANIFIGFGHLVDDFVTRFASF